MSSVQRMIAIVAIVVVIAILFVYQSKRSSLQDIQHVSSIQRAVQGSQVGLVQPIIGKVVQKSEVSPVRPITGKESEAGLVQPIIEENKSTDCCMNSEALTMTLEELCQNGGSISSVTGCECIDYMMCKIVVLTAISSNHFIELKDFIGSVHKYMPNTKIIVYNLGLKDGEIQELKSYCSLEVRNFQFNRYPKHASNLRFYAWKPLIVDEVSKEYELILYCDASCRLQKPLDSLLKHLVKFPLVGGAPAKFPMTTTTHDGMLKYLKLNYSRAAMSHVFESIEANSLIMWRTTLLKERILKPWVDCALHKACIAPQGSTLGGCKGYIYKHPETIGERYAGCHRYDQSAINMILFREFGLSITKQLVAVGNEVVKLQRKKTDKYIKEIKKC